LNGVRIVPRSVSGFITKNNPCLPLHQQTMLIGAANSDRRGHAASAWGGGAQFLVE
jgi:hypothetical protein